MKKILSFTMMGALLLLAACGSNPEASTTTPTTEVPSTTEIPTTEVPTTTEAPKKEETTIYLAGDSTVKTYEDNQFIAGWGQYLDLFLEDNVTVVNCAHGGRSSRSFINEGRLWNIDNSGFRYSFSQNGGKSIEDCIKAGDYLFIQFGHNDDMTKASSNYSTMYDRMVPIGTPDANGIYPTTPGVKTSTSSLPLEYTNLATDAEEAAALNEIAKYGTEYYAYNSGGTFKWYLKQYVDFAREKGATPVLITPVARVKWSGTSIVTAAGAHGANAEYVKAVRQLAEEENCLLIDMFAESKEMLETATMAYSDFLMALKPNSLTGSWPYDYDIAYKNDKLGYTGIEATHYNKYGAYLQAAMIAEAMLKDTHTDNEYFKFKDSILATPEGYVHSSNLVSKATIEKLEGLLEIVNVKDPNMEYPSPNKVIAAIAKLDMLGDMTSDNYLTFKEKIEEARRMYNSLNVDDRKIVEENNLKDLVAYEKQLQAFTK